jgi:lipid-binding SYLF domain-containing protein
MDISIIQKVLKKGYIRVGFLKRGFTMRHTFFVSLLLLPLFLTACATAPQNPQAKDVLSAQVREAISLFDQKDPSIQKFFSKSYGYAVLPKIGKGGFWVGGAFGRGEVFEQGKMVGYCSMSQATLGFTFGGEFFREIVFFSDKADLDKFKTEEYTFAAQVTGVALTEGAAAKADYKNGLAVFIMADKGLMVDASVGGQKFNYQPLHEQDY